MSRGFKNFKGYKFTNNFLAIAGLGVALLLNTFGLGLLRAHEVLGETFLFNFDAKPGRHSWSLLSILVITVIVILAQLISRHGIGSYVGKDKYTGDALVISSLIVGVVIVIVGIIVNPGEVQEMLNI